MRCLHKDNFLDSRECESPISQDQYDEIRSSIQMILQQLYSTGELDADLIYDQTVELKHLLKLNVVNEMPTIQRKPKDYTEQLINQWKDFNEHYLRSI